ncbi:MAG: hypothetical protein II791_06575, partial [Bacteroidales bacterium]|nr:hypothetical protein [Bacteroidales bacterium]
MNDDTPDAVALFASGCGADALVLSGLFEKSRTQALDALRDTILAYETAISGTQVSALLWDIPFDARVSAENAGILTAFSVALQDAKYTGMYVSSDVSGDAFAS